MNKEIHRRKIVIINVGISTKYGLPGPIFKDGTFKYVPIPESHPSDLTPIYANLGVGKWAPSPDMFAHYDPEFKTMTFGDYEFNEKGGRNIRVANALNLEPKDFLFFFASLANKRDRRLCKTTGLYVIGFFEIRKILPYREARLSTLVKQNAHRLRSNDSGYTIWKGTKSSGLLECAVPMSRRNVDKFLRTSSRELLPWGSTDKNGRPRTELEIINSATRASRLILRKHREKFWEVVLKYNPNLFAGKSF